jgi:hypothetical protein
MPTELADDIALPHPRRLPLGSSWRGRCSAPGHEQASLGAKELESCNLGYAKSCPRLPQDRPGDAVRFAVISNSAAEIRLQFVLERAYLPARHGLLNFSLRSGSWTSPDRDPGIQRKAECFLHTYLERMKRRSNVRL